MFLPKMYKKNIFEIPYATLKKRGIQCLVFDLDNTLRLIDEKTPSKKVEKLIRKLEKEFTVIILSNSLKKEVVLYKESLQVEGIYHAKKPSTKGLQMITNQYSFQPKEIAMIGDQLVTDILAGNRYGAYTIYVDALGKKDLKITYFNRFIERRIIHYYQKRNQFQRGVYYES